MLEQEKFELSTLDRVLVFGAGRGIGSAFVEKLLKDFPQSKVMATYREDARAQKLLSLLKTYPKRLEVKKIDPLCEDSLKNFADEITSKGHKVDLLINTIGFLSDERFSVEKSLRDISVDQLMYYFKVNTIPSALIAKHFYKLLKKTKPTCFISLSGKVGSIHDNRMGGWYGYRSSKSALNMILKNISLEFRRKKLSIITLSIHPGTTITDLSKPYIQSTNLLLHSPLETASNILDVIEGRRLEDSGKFLSWDGTEIPW